MPWHVKPGTMLCLTIRIFIRVERMKYFLNSVILFLYAAVQCFIAQFELETICIDNFEAK